MSLTCSYCLRHSTHLEVLHQRAKVKASAQLSPHLRVLGGFVDATPDAARRHMESHAWSFAYTVDASALNGLAQQLDTRRVMPRSYVVAPGGRVVQAVPGEMSLPDVLEWANLVPARAGP